MSDVVIVSAARTPVGSFNGAFAGLAAHELGRIAIEAAIARGGITAADVDEVLQEVSLVAWKKFATLDDPTLFPRWACLITRY